MASDLRPNIIPKYMDTFVFGSILSACREANTQLESVGKVTFCFGKTVSVFSKISTGVQRWSTSNISGSGHLQYVITGGFPKMELGWTVMWCVGMWLGHPLNNHWRTKWLERVHYCLNMSVSVSVQPVSVCTVCIYKLEKAESGRGLCFNWDSVGVAWKLLI